MQQVGLVDANNFFVSCERLFRPDLEGKPVAVLSSNDGCIVARSNEVKAMGVPMGIPLFQAKTLVDFENVTLFSSNFALYRDISRRVMQVVEEEVGECEVYSIDESFFTVSGEVTCEELQQLRQRIIDRTGIPVSIGVASTKTLAKVASKLAKKEDGTHLLRESQWYKLMAAYPLEDVWNLGGATARKLRADKLTTVRDFLGADRKWVASQFGVSGCRVYDELCGIQVHKVKGSKSELQQSVTSTRSFAAVTSKYDDVASALMYHVVRVAEELREKKLCARRLIVIARASRHSDFSYQAGSIEIPLDYPTHETKALLQAARKGLQLLYSEGTPYKKAGVVVSGLVPVSLQQTSLFEAPETRKSTLDTVTDVLNKRFGADTIRPAVVQRSGSRTSALLRSPRYTTSWNELPVAVAR